MDMKMECALPALLVCCVSMCDDHLPCWDMNNHMNNQVVSGVASIAQQRILIRTSSPPCLQSPPHTHTSDMACRQHAISF